MITDRDGRAGIDFGVYMSLNVLVDCERRHSSGRHVHTELVATELSFTTCRARRRTEEESMTRSPSRYRCGSVAQARLRSSSCRLRDAQKSALPESHARITSVCQNQTPVPDLKRNCRRAFQGFLIDDAKGKMTRRSRHLVACYNDFQQGYDHTAKARRQAPEPICAADAIVIVNISSNGIATTIPSSSSRQADMPAAALIDLHCTAETGDEELLDAGNAARDNRHSHERNTRRNALNSGETFAWRVNPAICAMFPAQRDCRRSSARRC